MCFSTTASFGAAALLSWIGIASIRKTQAASLLPIAGIPLVFAAQQFSEGCVWIGAAAPGSSVLQRASVYTFLIFALIVWPSWIPISVFLSEKNPSKRPLLASASVVGSLFSLGAALVLYRDEPSVKIAGHHLNYDLNLSFGNDRLLEAAYLTATAFAPLISSLPGMRLVGALILLSFLASKLLFPGAVISVWCYFAALISLVIYEVIPPRRQPLWGH